MDPFPPFPADLPPLAWVGLAGQALFALRALSQWWASERAGRSLAPESYWWLSLAGTAGLLTYAASTRDPVFVLGPLANGFIYARNLQLSRRTAPRRVASRAALLPFALLLAASGVAAAAAGARDGSIVRIEPSRAWLVLGLAGASVFGARHWVQWWISERRGHAVLPAAFWWLSTAGAVALLAYAIHRGDWVFICAYALSPIPYVRNLMLLRAAREHPRGQRQSMRAPAPPSGWGRHG